jgi:hypothetical protein
MVNGDGGLGSAGAGANSTMGTNPVGGTAQACTTPVNPRAIPTTPVPVPKPPIGPVINIAKPIVLVRKIYIPQVNAVRTRIDLTVDDTSFDGSGTLTIVQPGGTKVDFFNAQTGGTLLTTNGPLPFTGAALDTVATIWAEGVHPSAAMDDIKLTLSLTPGSRPVKPPVSKTLTCVEVTLDICQSRTAPTTDPAVMATPTALPAAAPTPGALGDKIQPGRFVHTQDTAAPAFHHGRAMLIVRKAVPNAFPGDLELRSFDGRVQAFPAAKEIAASGQTAVTLPLTIGNGTIPATGMKFWAEGISVSGALNDTGFKLGVPGLGQDGDWAKMTVVEFQSLSVSIPSTPPQPLRAAQGTIAVNGPVADTTVQVPNAHVTSRFSENDNENRALVLIENSLPAAKSVTLTTAITPAAAQPWVQWSSQRDVRSGVGDAAGVISANANALPTLTPNAGNKLSAKFKVDSVGTFHIRPFIDCNGNNTFEHNVHPSDQRIDREPFMIMNLILIHLNLFDNTLSRSDATHVVINPAAPTTATRISVSTTTVVGPWVVGTENQMATHNNASVTVIGGGSAGKNGLDRLFGGWVNNELTVAASPTVPQGEDVVAEYNDPSTAPPTVHPRTSIWTATNPGTRFLPTPPPPPPPAVAPPPPAPPSIVGGPFLDTTNFGGEGVGGNTCVGTEGAIGPPKPINKTAIATGERWRVEMWDSPGDNAPLRHEGFPGTAANQIPIIRYRFNIDFRSDLVFWTNYVKVPTAAGNPAACLLYASVQSNRWNIRISFRYDAPTVANPAAHPPVVAAPGASHQVTKTISMVKLAKRATQPVEDNGLQVRSPVSLNLLAIDART